MAHNPNCSGSHCVSETGEVRVYPLGGGANNIYCETCFGYENAHRMRMVKQGFASDDFAFVDWETAEIYSAAP